MGGAGRAAAHSSPRLLRTHLGQPLLTLGIPRRHQGLLGLLDEQSGAFHHVPRRVQHRTSPGRVARGCSHTPRRLCQGLQRLGRFPGSHPWRKKAGKSGQQPPGWPFLPQGEDKSGQGRAEPSGQRASRELPAGHAASLFCREIRWEAVLDPKS